MKCVICKKGESELGCITVTLERDSLLLVVKDVPASVCSNCGEEYVDQETSKRLLALLEEASRSGVLLDVRQYRAA